ncbi:MAG: ferritin family protein [Nitrospinaceae bacterium]
MATANSTGKWEMKTKVSTENPSFSFHCVDAIEVSLYIEKQGLMYYEKAAGEARNPRVRAIFQQLAQEEKEHIHSLQAKARYLQPALSKKSDSRKQVDLFITGQLKGRVFPVTKGSGRRDLPRVDSDAAALDLGIESEKRSIEVLSELLHQEKKIDVRVIFSHLLVEEKKHLAALEELKRSFSLKPG